MMLTPESVMTLFPGDCVGLAVGEFWVYRLNDDPVEYTAPCPNCGRDITWICWWFEGVPLAGGLKRENCTATEPGPCLCDGVQVVREELAST